MIRFLVATFAAVILTAAPAHAEDHRNYIAVGDSITDGVGTSDWVTNPDGSRTRVAYAYSYPEQANLRSIGVGSACLAGCGSLSSDQWVLQRLNALADRPETVILELGVNDFLFGSTADQVIARTKVLRRSLRDHGYRVVVSTVVPPPANSAWSHIQAPRLAFNNWVRGEALFVDYAKPLQCNQWQCPGLTNMADVHVNDTGAAIMANTLRSWVLRDAG